MNNSILNAKEEFLGILTDEEIYEKADDVCKAIDTYVNKTSGLNGEIQGKSENGTYAEVASIKQAIADAKANVLVTDTPKEEYTDADFTTPGGTLYTAAKKKIDLAVAEYGLEKVNELYAKEVTNPTDKVLSVDQHNKALNALLVKDGEIDEKNIQEAKHVVNKLNTLEADLPLKDVIEYYKNELTKFVNANYNNNFESEFGNIPGVLADKDVKHLKDVAYMADAIAEGTAKIDAARSSKAVVEALESAKADTVAALRGVINNAISVLTTYGNASNKLLDSTAAKTMRDVMDKDYETVDAEAKALADAFRTMLNVANVK